MSITVDLSPAEEALLSNEAKQDGLDASELAVKLLREHLGQIPEDAMARVHVLLRRWQQETETDVTPSGSIHELFARWAEEDAQLSDEEVAANERLWQDYQQGIDEERQLAGMRPLFNG